MEYRFEITDAIKDEIERIWGKPLNDIADDEAKDIISQFVDPVEEIIDASFSDEREIVYEIAEDDDEDEDEPRPEWSESYLNYIGMSMSDFI